jgi:hypothetical protein
VTIIPAGSILLYAETDWIGWLIAWRLGLTGTKEPLSHTSRGLGNDPDGAAIVESTAPWARRRSLGYLLESNGRIEVYAPRVPWTAEQVERLRGFSWAADGHIGYAYLKFLAIVLLGHVPHWLRGFLYCSGLVGLTEERCRGNNYTGIWQGEWDTPRGILALARTADYRLWGVIENHELEVLGDT